MALRSIVRIDEELCTGCGLCVTPCAEGAIEIVDGKAKVMKEELCDGAGFCLAVCPRRPHRREARSPRLRRGGGGRKMAQKLAAAATIQQTCFNCGRSEMDGVLFPCRLKGESLWACARCLPQLIHG